MNTKTIAVLIALCCLQISGNLPAQDTLKAKSDSVPVYYATAKVVHYTGNLHDLENMSTVNLKIATNVDQKVTNSFYTSFKGAENDKWFFHDKKGKEYLVKFDYDKKDYKVLLDKKGKVFYTMFDGIERDLSGTIRKNIKAWYPDYNVVGLIKVNTNDKNASIVNLNRGNDLMIISVENEVISELAPYRLARINVKIEKKKENRNGVVAAKKQ